MSFIVVSNHLVLCWRIWLNFIIKRFLNFTHIFFSWMVDFQKIIIHFIWNVFDLNVHRLWIECYLFNVPWFSSLIWDLIADSSLFGLFEKCLFFFDHLDSPKIRQIAQNYPILNFTAPSLILLVTHRIIFLILWLTFSFLSNIIL